MQLMRKYYSYPIFSADTPSVAADPAHEALPVLGWREQETNRLVAYATPLSRVQAGWVYLPHWVVPTFRTLRILPARGQLRG